MRTVGVDLAAEPAKTAVAVLDWAAGGATVMSLTIGAGDEQILRMASGAERVGIDAPFGWPDAFVKFVAAHHDHQAPATKLATRDDRRPMTKRHTDVVVQATTGAVPLSVSADRIAHVALRCAGLLAEFRAIGVDVDRVRGAVCEVYPAAALRTWHMASKGYKGSGSVGFDALVSAIEGAAPWLALGEFRPLFASNDDAFDAVVSALIARAVALGRTAMPTADNERLAAREGWIHVPTGTLDALLTGTFQP
ncbi:DUF429 domain-containing protein [Smaragdicoccus niigatensis]|uniref:DUF429 domain-containing protein n=1 Tax=Smaragdicoccus niigatensis TaxID=359359 RepID=UPI00035CB091|nr:DUF429 domain-containing protein [Smaragdicoccus niigatensis]